MICSVLIPSRGRHLRLMETMYSVEKSVDDPSQIEILVRLDEDDKASVSAFHDTVSHAPDAVGHWPGRVSVRKHVGPRLRGYPDINLFYTELAKLAKGKWVWIMNDDAVITGLGWDTLLAEVPTEGFIVQPELYQLGHSKYFNSEGGAFPIVPNGCWERFGETVIPDPADVQLDELLRKKNHWMTCFLRGVGVVHDRDNDEQLAQHRQL